MPDLTTIFERQAAWQRARAKLSWTEKLRLAAKLRDVALSMRQPTPRGGHTPAAAESGEKYGRWRTKGVKTTGNTLWLVAAFVTTGAFVAPVFAASAIATVDGGGQRTASANYAMDGSIGGIGDAATGGVVVLKPGFIGQLTEVTNLALHATPASVNEGETSQLSGIAGLDDATVVVIEGSNVVWTAPVHPVGTIGPDGQATLANVYADTSGIVTGQYLGVTGSGLILVLNSNPDNFGLYAGDEIPDDWQVRFFGQSNPDGLASATNATGQNNLYAYIADLCPTNPASRFEIVAVSNRTPTNAVCFLSSSNRLYRLEWSTNLVAGSWTNLPGAIPVTGNGSLFWLADPNAASPRFYKVMVRVPQNCLRQDRTTRHESRVGRGNVASP